ncbi:MAG TPA: UDP-N-acetylmuramate--L-alanine ligase [Aeriscardovia aeriphila]|uniref:UDP-N-acetylmuramate--L-alanine ligase n=1 Tax=Aeriscardovia aeriphila TaxID=218139 RepID=A0A921KAQ9_9BIFI|nr:UDP-N-acetylmuramate--L-alanine ligase [Aeriscardovia aeriphila]
MVDEVEARPLPADDSLAQVKSFADLGRVWFIGIGGSGMSVLAQMLHEAGVPVSGSDRTASHYTEHLESIGIPVTIGQKPENIHDVDTVVWSSAISADAPEMLEARRQGLLLAHRSDILALFLRTRNSIAVAGTHGKTTTSSMLATIFANAHAAGEVAATEDAAAAGDASVAGDAAFADPSFAIGGSVKTAHGTIPGGHVGTGSWMVAEADESDGSFEKYRPLIGVVTNAEGDHLDHYGTVAHYRSAFAAYIGHIQRAVVLCGDDEGAREVYNSLEPRIQQQVWVYSTDNLEKLGLPGLSEKNFVQIVTSQEMVADKPTEHGGIEETLTVRIPSSLVDGGAQVSIGLHVPGIHNARNATAALTAALLAGVSLPGVVHGLESFLGAARRFDFQGEVNGVSLYNDYGHHPTEVATFLRAARRRFPHSTLRVLFQPHTYSRTQTFTKELVDALDIADDVYLSHLFAARELASDYPGISTQTLIDEAKKRGIDAKFHYIDDMYEAGIAMAHASHPGDILSTVGGGDINLVNPTILDALHTLDR